MVECKITCELDKDGQNICCYNCDMYIGCGNPCEQKPYNCADKIEIIAEEK